MSFLGNRMGKLIVELLSDPEEGERGKVYLPRFLWILGVICGTPLLVVGILLCSKGQHSGIAFILFSLLGLSLIMAYFHCRITYDEEGFYARNFLGVRRHYTYDQVTGIRKNTHETFLYVGKRRIMVDTFAIGGEKFIKTVKKEYSKHHNGKFLPNIKNTKWDPFRGNIRNPGTYVTGYIIVGLLMVAFLFQVLYSLYVPDSPNSTKERNVFFQSWQMEEDNLLLRASDDMLYKIIWIDETVDLQRIRELCDGETILTAYADTDRSDEGEEYYLVKALFCQGEEIIGFEDTDRIYRQETWSFIFLPIAGCVAWAVFVILSIVVGRNPKKFRKKIKKSLFGNDYIGR